MTSPSLARRARSALFVALRAVFRAIPLRESTRDAVRSKLLRAFPTVRPLPAQGQVTAPVERRPRVRADERCIGYVEYSEEPLPDPLPATLVAFYLPQFHTIPENDEWWGKGFTEWRNVARALPQFEGHLQPRLPGDLGFYDLRNPQVMRDQAKLAKTYGLSAFCFYFYWFGGKTLLEEPLRNWLADKSIDFQYCLCWANENWTRRWDGRDDELLIAQNHSPEDDIAFIEHVADYLRDPRYLRVDGKPMLLLYRPDSLPDAAGSCGRWRKWCRDNHIGEIYIAYVQSFQRHVPSTVGCDAAVGFPPNISRAEDISAQQHFLNEDFSGRVLDWRELPAAYPTQRFAYRYHPGVNCGWDNEPRRPAGGRIFKNFSLSGYSSWLRTSLTSQADVPSPQSIVFINAWNEWAEGAFLEPDAHFGHARLDATRAAICSLSAAYTDPLTTPLPLVVLHAWHEEIVEEIAESLRRANFHFRLVVTSADRRARGVESVLNRYGLHPDMRVFENRGRDILPFLRVAASIREQDTDLILKLHTKKSPHRSDGAAWRRQLVNSLLPTGQTQCVVDALKQNSEIGLLAPDGNLVSLSTFWGANKQNVLHLSQRMGLADVSLGDARFASGSMFWTRVKGLAPLVDTPIWPSDFEDESGQLDGTFAHAVERVFAASVRAAGLKSLEVSDVLQRKH
jgi:lipopolysaccharide biosynthesis protein